jgi:hypothetical protein
VIHVFSRRVACAGAGSQQQAPPPQEEQQQDQWWTEKGWCDENGLWWSEEEWAKFYEEERLRKVHTHARARNLVRTLYADFYDTTRHTT